MRYFFTYVWGAPGQPAWPLTFSKKQSRTQALNQIEDGDIVYTVGTLSEPTDPKLRGRVLGRYTATRCEVNTRDFDPAGRELHRTARDFPYALQPSQAWEITDQATQFSDLSSMLSNADRLQAQSGYSRLPGEIVVKLEKLPRIEIPVAFPVTDFGCAELRRKVRRLAPEHRGTALMKFCDYKAWYVYVMSLRNRENRVVATKIGYSHDPKQRVDAYNNCVAREVTELVWHLDGTQSFKSESSARFVEQTVLDHYYQYCLGSNPEVLRFCNTIELQSLIARLARERVEVA